MPSAIGLRQTLPVQTNRMVFIPAINAVQTLRGSPENRQPRKSWLARTTPIVQQTGSRQLGFYRGGPHELNVPQRAVRRNRGRADHIDIRRRRVIGPPSKPNRAGASIPGLGSFRPAIESQSFPLAAGHGRAPRRHWCRRRQCPKSFPPKLTVKVPPREAAGAS